GLPGSLPPGNAGCPLFLCPGSGGSPFRFGLAGLGFPAQGFLAFLLGLAGFFGPLLRLRAAAGTFGHHALLALGGGLHGGALAVIGQLFVVLAALLAQNQTDPG